MRSFVSERYELLREVDEGPIGKLYEGRLRASAGFGRPVAVRQLSGRLANNTRFVGTWAAAAAELADRPSPHLEAMLDLVVVGDQVYFVTEWIEGLGLARFAEAAAPLPWTIVARIVIGVLDGLHRAHERNPPLCHRGVTPSAVRVSIDGAVKLLRFGVAAGLGAIGEGRAQMERDGLWHPAPELRAGESATPESDLYGAGALAFTILTGRVPGDDPDLGVARNDAPPLFAGLIEKALREEPRDRFASADEMARALERMLRAEPEPCDARALGLAVRSVRERADLPRSAVATGPAALAASVRGMASSEPKPATEPAEATPQKRPVGLPPQNTMHVDPSELTEVTEDGEEKPKRYRFEPKERQATQRARGLTDQESEALPLLLQKKPTGLAPARTEHLDADEVEKLRIEERRPMGLRPAKTEYLDEEQVERLTIPGEPSAKHPRGLTPVKTEYLDEDQVDHLTVDEE